MAARIKAATILQRPLPSEAGALQVESQELEPIRWQAEQDRASAVAFYYRAKAANIEALKDWPRSAVAEVAKARAYRQLWAMEDAEGLARAVDSRAMKVAQHLKLLDGR